MAARQLNAEYGLSVGNASAVLGVVDANANISGNVITATANITAPQLISNVATGTAPLVVTSTTQVANLSVATAGSATTAGTVTTAAQPNITSVGTLSSLAVTANANVGNLNSAGRVIATDTLLVGSTGGEGGQLTLGYVGISGITGQANSTWNVDVDGSNNFRIFTQYANGAASTPTTFYPANNNVNFPANVAAGYFIGNGSQLTGIVATAGSSIVNGTSNVNIPSSGGNVNISVGGTANTAIFSTSGITSNGVNAFVATGSAYNNVALGMLSANASNGANMAIRDFSSVTSTMYFDVAIGGTANGSFQFRTTSGFSSLATISNAGLTLSTGVFNGNGNSLSSLQGANVTGQVGNALVAGTVYTAAQPNITSVGTLSSLSVTGNANVGNIGATQGVFTNVSGNGSTLSSITGSNVTGQVGFAAVANSVAGANVSGAVAYATVANSVAGANVSGQVGNALVAGTVYTASQPNITSVGTLTSLTVNGLITALTSATTTGTTITPTAGSTNQYEVTALATGATIAAPSGTPVDGQRLILRIKDNGTPQTLTWTTSSGAYRARNVTLPTTTVASTPMYIGCIYNTQDTFWDVLAVTN